MTNAMLKALAKDFKGFKAKTENSSFNLCRVEKYIVKWFESSKFLGMLRIHF